MFINKKKLISKIQKEDEMVTVIKPHPLMKLQRFLQLGFWAHELHLHLQVSCESDRKIHKSMLLRPAILKPGSRYQLWEFKDESHVRLFRLREYLRNWSNTQQFDRRVKWALTQGWSVSRCLSECMQQVRMEQMGIQSLKTGLINHLSS